MDSTPLLGFARQTAVAAGDLLEQQLTQPRQLTSKGFRDIVTDADYAAQKLITSRIQATYPNHGFLTEEEDGELPETGELIWIIDPIDGTSNFSRQIPLFCVSIAAARRSERGLESEIGVIYVPLLDECYTARRGAGAWLNGRLIQVSETDALENAIFTLDWSHAPTHRAQSLAVATTLSQEVKTLRAVGSAAIALAWLAAGRLDGFFNRNIQAWDVAAGMLLVHEAGGRLSTPNGSEFTLDDFQCVASNGRLHPPILSLIQPHLPPD